jgi:hypothetical protein
MGASSSTTNTVTAAVLPVIAVTSEREAASATTLD